MSIEHLLAQKLSQTIIDGKLDIEIAEDLEKFETIDEGERFESSAAHSVIGIESESIISKLDDENSGLEINRYEVKGLSESINKDEFVLIVQDSNLDRVVEAHVLNQEAATESNSELIHEAMVLSVLEHPGIPPIYDLNVSQNHLVYCTLKRIEGTTLSQICSNIGSSDDPSLGAFDHVPEIVGNFIKIADIMSYAHGKDIIHRNIKPENLVIGDFGEVYVTAWGNAFDANRDDPDFNVLRGTPLYMSPEQASCLELDRRSDIYSLGASLFHVLLKRPPVLKESLGEFWEMKKSGAVDAYRPGVDRPIDKPLLAICMRCLESDPANRYQSMTELVDDLKHYQNGQMVEVHKYGVIELLNYWLANNKMHLRWAAAIILVLLTLGFVFYEMREQELSGWGTSIYEETFSQGDEWREHWALRKEAGDFIVKDDKLVTKNGPEFIWYYNKKLHGGVAIEFEGEMLPGSTPGDLSIVYCEDIEGLADGHRGKNIYYLQHGAVGNACSMIEGPIGRLDYFEKELQRGVKYHVRGEVNGKQLRLYLNGELTCSYDLLFPLNSGYIGLYAYYENKTFDNIKIYNRELPKVTNIIKTGDLLLENELYDLAIERYTAISEQYKGSEIGQEGQYKLGLCHYRKGEVDKAFEIWDTMKKSSFGMQINFYRWEQLAEAENYSELLRHMYALYRSAKVQVRTQIREQWGRYLYKVRASGNRDLVREFLRFRNVNFPQDQIFSLETFSAYHLLGQPEKALELFPNQKNVVMRSLSEMGEFQRIIDSYPEQRSSVAAALARQGHYQRVVDEFPDLRGHRIGAMISLGKFDQIKQEYGDSENVRLQLLMAQGKYDEVLERYKGTDAELDVFYKTGDAKAFLEQEGDLRNSIRGHDCRVVLLLDRYMAGEQDVLSELYDCRAGLNYWQVTSLAHRFTIDLLPDMLMCLNGNEKPIKETLDRIWEEKQRMYGMRHWYNVGLMSGKISLEEYLNQPSQVRIKAEALLHQAFHQDLFGNKTEALKLYKEYMSLPPYQKDFLLSRERFVEYRLKQIK